MAQNSEGPSPKVLKLGGPAGVENYSNNNWGIVAAVLKNAADHPVELLATSFFADEPNLQYGRELWIPPRSIRSSWYPVRAPGSRSRTSNALQVESMLYDRTGGAEKLILGESEKRTYGELLAFNPEPWVTALLPAHLPRFRPGEEGHLRPSEEPHRMDFEAVVALRLTGISLTQRLRVFETDPLPPTAESLQQVDQLVLSSDRLKDDPAALDAVRGWVQNGGLLWVMLDQVDPTTVARLFGEAVDFEIVDRVSLTRAAFAEKETSGGTPPTLEFDEPVDFVRVIATDVDVRQTVNGWPAAFWKAIGRGKVLFTTLEPQAWVRQRRPNDTRPIDSKYIAVQPLERIADMAFDQEETTDFQVAQLEPLLGEQIGYEIVRRGPVLLVLAAFCAAVLLAGVWLYRSERLERLGWVGPLGALIAASALISMGMQSKKSAPNTTAVAQIVLAMPGTEHVSMTGLEALYRQSESSEQIGAQRGGLLTPTLQGMEGATRRMVWTDRDAWHWENLTLPGSAVTLAPFQWTSKVGAPIEAWGTFGPEGFTGTFVRGPLEECGDAFIMHAMQPGVAARLGSDGALSASADDVLATGQFVTDTLLTDEQRRRQSAARMMFPRPTPDNKDATVRTHFFDVPTLLVWAKALDTRFSFPASERHVGSAFVQIPLRIERPPSGSDILIPTTFLRCGDVAGPEGFRGSGSTYYDRKGYWEEKASAARTWLRFELPRDVLPLEVKQATLSLSIKAPSRKVEIEGVAGSAVVKLAERQSPVGTLEFKVDRADALRLDSNGGFLIGINVGEAVADAQPGGANAAIVNDPDAVQMKWRIDGMWLDVRGVTLEP